MENKNVYVGHRYVPKIMGEHDKTQSYEGLSIVTHEGTSYTSKKHVPFGIDITNTEYWVVTGNYNAQVDYYRQEVRDIQENITDINNDIDNVNNDINDIVTNIKDFGAIENEDSTTAIQDAIDHVFNNGGGKVYIPTGTFLYSNDIHLKTGVFLEGNGELSILENINNKRNSFIIYNNTNIRDLRINVTENYNDNLFYFSNEYLRSQNGKNTKPENVRVFIEGLIVVSTLNENTPNKTAIKMFSTHSNIANAWGSGYAGVRFRNSHFRGFRFMVDMETQETGWINGGLFDSVVFANFETAVKIRRSNNSLGIDYNHFKLYLQTGEKTKDIIDDPYFYSTNYYNDMTIWDMSSFENSKIGTGLIHSVTQGRTMYPKNMYTSHLQANKYYYLGRMLGGFTSNTKHVALNLKGLNGYDTDLYIRGDRTAGATIEMRTNGSDLYNSQIEFYFKELSNGDTDLYMKSTKDSGELYNTIYIDSIRDFYPSPYTIYDNVDGLTKVTNVIEYANFSSGSVTGKGYWNKLEDGTLICYIESGNNGLKPNIEIGSIYRSEIREWEFPVEFIDIPIVTVSVAHANRWGDINSTPSKSKCSYVLYQGQLSESTSTVFLKAVGRWK